MLFTVFLLSLASAVRDKAPQAHPPNQAPHSSCGSSSSSSCSSSSSSCHPNLPFYPPQAFYSVPIKLGAGYYRFTFGQHDGTWAQQSFTIKLTERAIVNVFDCFCYGDTFMIFDNGSYPSDPVTYVDCDEGSDECLQYWDTTEDCIAEAGNCRISTSLAAGCHNLTVYVRESNYHGGDGFLGVFPLVCTADTCSQQEVIYYR